MSNGFCMMHFTPFRNSGMNFQPFVHIVKFLFRDRKRMIEQYSHAVLRLSGDFRIKFPYKQITASFHMAVNLFVMGIRNIEENFCSGNRQDIIPQKEDADIIQYLGEFLTLFHCREKFFCKLYLKLFQFVNCFCQRNLPICPKHQCLLQQ